MDHFRTRERRRLLEDLIALQREEDVQRQCESVIYNLKGVERHRFDSDDDDEHKNCQHRRKEYFLVKLTYQNPNTRQGRNMDEILIIQHHRTVFKGCLKNGDHFTFKSQRYRNDSRIKLKFYVNDLLEEERTGCCEHGLMNKNRQQHLFEIENIVGTKPCDDCDFDDKDASRISSPISYSNSPTKVQIPPSISRSSSEQSEDQSYARKPKEKKSALSIPQTHNNNKASSEGFSGDITEFSNDHTELPNHQSDEESADVLPSIPQPSSSKRTYGPPQISTMPSIRESLDTPTPDIRESVSGNLFNSSIHTLQRAASHSSSHPIFTRSDSVLSTQTTERLSRQTSTIEPNQNEQEIIARSTNSNNNVAVSDTIQLLLARLGVIRQEQAERPEVSSAAPPREKGNVEDFILIYLHEFDPDTSVIKHLRSLVNFVKVFNDTDDCVAFINSISNEKILFILSNSFYNSIISRIEDLQQICTIYILSDEETSADLPEKQFKIRGVYQDLNDIYAELSNDINKIRRDLIIYLNASSNATSVGPLVVYFLLLGEIILDQSGRKDDMNEFIHFVREEYEGNDEELQIIDEFEKTYQKNHAIYWFSRPCFISKMLNKALRIPLPDVLFRFRLFIQDLFQQIETESTSESITVYLGQTIQPNDLDDLQKNILTNDILIFPQFLFASTDQTRAIRIAKEIPSLNAELIPLVIHVEIPEEMKCANFNSLRYSTDADNNVLLNMNMMGRLIKIEQENINEDPIATVYIRLVKSNDQENLQQILETTRAELKSFSPFASVIKLMIQMNQQASAEQFVQTMFDDETVKTDGNVQGSIAASCHILAQSYRAREDYQRALGLYLLSLNTLYRILSPKAVELTSLYSNIGSMYFRLVNYDKSLEYYQKALENQIHSRNPDLNAISVFTNSIGTIYLKQRKYPEAIKSFERTIRILQQLSEPYDTELATIYDSLGDAYLAQTKFADALDNYNKALEIQESLVPQNSQTLGTICHTMGNIYLKLDRSKEALTYLKRALEYLQQILPLTHPTFASLYNNIGLMYSREEQYPEALQAYSKTLEIAAIASPENHSLVGVVLFNIALIYSKQEKFDEAIESLEKSTAQFLKTLSVDHPDVVENQIFIESIKQKKVLKDIFREDTTSS